MTAFMMPTNPSRPGDSNPGSHATAGDWQLQVDFIPGPTGEVVGVSYSQFSGKMVWCAQYKVMCGAYSHTVYPLKLTN